ncbi:MAG: ABC transporter ATP-binding protein [Polyangiaceae bacterium]|nr:ABC transporter ATP-binding protein [Polyangiaceae bacterium]
MAQARRGVRTIESDENVSDDEDVTDQSRPSASGSDRDDGRCSSGGEGPGASPSATGRRKRREQRIKYAVETFGLTKVYRGKIQALRAVDLKVPLGAAFGLLGPNGAGKSTLVKTLLSIVAPTAGAGTLLGKDISLAAARRGVGYLPEGHRFPHYLSGRGALEYFGRLGGLRGDELADEVESKLTLVGMAEWGSTRVTKYSKGMQQRIGLAQAMLGHPQLVFLDEPTDGVDPIGRHQIRELIKELCRQGTTVFLNSHLLLEVEQICDHVAIMHHGRILRQGSTDAVRDAVRADRALLDVRFTTGPLDAEARAAVERVGVVTDVEGGGIEVALKDDDEISAVIDVLREHAVRITAVEPRRANLEEAFIALIDQQEDQSVGGVR